MSKPTLRKTLLAGLALLLAVFVAYTERARLLKYAGLRPGPQSQTAGSVVFVNETDSHTYDRALRLSVQTAQKRSGIQNAVILLQRRPTSASLENLAAELFEKYRIGRDFGGKGILLLYVEEERQLKIEVSYALEGTFPDAICNRLEEGARTFMLIGQRRDFLTELLVTMNLQYVKYRDGAAPADEIEFPFAADAFSLSRQLSGGAGVVGRDYSQAIEARLREVRSLSEAGRREYRPDGDPAVVVERYLSSLENGVGDPLLPLLTEGSQVYRLENPKTPGYQRRTSRYYAAARPYRVHTKGGLAAAMFQPGNPVLQVFLRRTEAGMWLVDEAHMWAEQHLFEDELNPIQKYPHHPFEFGWILSQHPDQILYPYSQARAPLAYPHRLREEIATREKALAAEPGNAENYFALADLLYFETYWLSAVIPLYEAGLRLAPDRNDMRWRLVDLYTNNTDAEQMLYQYRELQRIYAGDENVRQIYDTYRTGLGASDAEVANFSPVSLTVPKSAFLERITPTQTPTTFQVLRAPSVWPPKKGAEFPDLELRDPQGQTHRLSEWKGVCVLVEPVGMSCPACQAFSGAHRRGRLGSVEPQRGLPSIEELFRQRGIDLSDPRVRLVQLLLYDLDMRPPVLSHAEQWRAHFDFGKGPLHDVLAGGPHLQNEASFSMIPGFYLVDADFVVISDATGHNPADDLYTQLFPLLEECVTRVGSTASGIGGRSRGRAWGPRSGSSGATTWTRVLAVPLGPRRLAHHGEPPEGVLP